MAVSIEQAREAKQRAIPMLKASLPVVGVGLVKSGADYAIKVNLARDIAKADLPSSCGGVALVYEVVGTLKPR